MRRKTAVLVALGAVLLAGCGGADQIYLDALATNGVVAQPGMESDLVEAGRIACTLLPGLGYRATVTALARNDHGGPLITSDVAPVIADAASRHLCPEGDQQ